MSASPDFYFNITSAVRNREEEEEEEGEKSETFCRNEFI